LISIKWRDLFAKDPLLTGIGWVDLGSDPIWIVGFRSDGSERIGRCGGGAGDGGRRRLVVSGGGVAGGGQKWLSGHGGLGESGGDEERVYGLGRPGWKPDSGMRRRITERRRQRATPREGERDRGKRKGRGASHHAEQLRRRAGVEERRRSSGIGGGTELERSSNGGRGAS